MRIDPAEYRQLPLRSHTLLADAPIHDVWAIDLPGGRPGQTVLDLQSTIDVERLRSVNPLVTALFSVRGWMGRVFKWDRERGHPPRDSIVSRLSPAERDSSLVAPGSPDGSRWTVFVSSRESISELQNATVHAFSVVVMMERLRGYRMYWAIYVQPVGPLTSWYFRLIDPFRRLIIYPAVLREVQRTWVRAQTPRAESPTG